MDQCVGGRGGGGGGMFQCWEVVNLCIQVENLIEHNIIITLSYIIFCSIIISGCK